MLNNVSSTAISSTTKLCLEHLGTLMHAYITVKAGGATIYISDTTIFYTHSILRNACCMHECQTANLINACQYFHIYIYYIYGNFKIN